MNSKEQITGSLLLLPTRERSIGACLLLRSLAVGSPCIPTLCSSPKNNPKSLKSAPKVPRSPFHSQQYIRIMDRPPNIRSNGAHSSTFRYSRQRPQQLRRPRITKTAHILLRVPNMKCNNKRCYPHLTFHRLPQESSLRIVPQTASRVH